MTRDLFPPAAPVDFADRAVSPRRELGAYEALWAREKTWFKSIAEDFEAHPGAVPSDFVSEADVEKYARLALEAIQGAGIQHFGVRVHGAGDYPSKLRDATHPVELLYFQGLWDLVNTRCVAIVGTREPSPEGLRRAAKLAKLFVADGFTVVSGLARGSIRRLTRPQFREAATPLRCWERPSATFIRLKIAICRKKLRTSTWSSARFPSSVTRSSITVCLDPSLSFSMMCSIAVSTSKWRRSEFANGGRMWTFEVCSWLGVSAIKP
jgi:hypothetical protein